MSDVKKDLENRAVKHLVSSGLCSAADLRKASRDAALLSAGDAAQSIKALERAFKALGDHGRIMLLSLLLRREMCVCELMSALGMSQPTASRNLNMLERAGLVQKRRAGKWAFYSAGDSQLLDVIAAAVRLGGDSANGRSDRA